MTATEPKHPIEKLIAVMARLRDKESGCPWDIEQDFNSIAPYTIEEAYEVLDAIKRGNIDDLREELGDLLLQPIYHAQMAAEQNLFDIYDVINDITDKMIARHPHVFGDETARSAGDVSAIWDAQKKAEKPAGSSALDGVARALPALMRAEKLQKRAAKTGFEFTTADGALEKFMEELSELQEAAAQGNSAHIAEELGDAIFALANYGRMLGVDCESALRDCNEKFERRFKAMESKVKLEDTSLEDMLKLWREAR